jgi:hypothetical protein
VRCSALRGGFRKTFSPRFGKLVSLMLNQLRAAATLYASPVGLNNNKKFRRPGERNDMKSRYIFLLIDYW